MEKSIIKVIERALRKYWDMPALTNYGGATFTYKDVARKIVKIHIVFEKTGIQKGDKIAFCGKNSASWGVAFLAALTYGAVPVPILHEFKPDNIHNIVNHSESKILFCGDEVWTGLDEASMPALIGVVRIEDYSLRVSRSESLTDTRKNLNRIFGERYPERFTPDHISFFDENPEEVGIINYTSGTTSASKGVMLPYRSLMSNIQFTIDNLGTKAGETMIAMLPMAHMYGLSFEFIHHFISGVHIFFLTKVPSPKILIDAMQQIKPSLIITVPLVVEKIIKKKIFPEIERPTVNFMLKVPVISEKIYKKIHDQLRSALGGNFRQLIVGGAPINCEIERFLKKIKFEYTVGYGMTEYGPLLAYSPWDKFAETSCGRTIDRMEIKIDSFDPQNVVGEILARGENMMIGYYKNPEATAQFIDKDGWGHTGDLGLMDKDGNIFIKGRIKNMILGPSGQNIYPEEVEDKINNLFFVNESIVVEKEGKLVALIYPDFDSLRSQNIPESEISSTIEKYVLQLNKELPVYSQIKGVKIYNEEFEKTPKRSIKRYLYQ